MQQNQKIYQGRIVTIDPDKQCFTILAENQKTCTLPLSAWQEPFDVQIGDEVEFGKNEQGVWVRYFQNISTSSSVQIFNNQPNFRYSSQEQMNYDENPQFGDNQFEYYKSNFNHFQKHKETIHDDNAREAIDYSYGLFRSYLLTWKRCFDYSGRSRRKEYWYFGIMASIIIFIFVIFTIPLSALFAAMTTNYDYQFQNNFELVFSVMMAIVILGGLFIHAIPAISLNIRRFHDIGLSGWYCLLCYIPYIGVLASIFISFKDSVPEENKWGESVKYGESRLNRGRL